MDWDAYDDAYAAAPYAFPATYLEVPADGCIFGCVPLKRSNATLMTRLAATLPFRGKCFTAAAKGDMVGGFLSNR